MIPYGRQSISDEDVAAVVEALRSDWLTQGPAIERFEAAVADYCGVTHAVAVANGTAALHAAAYAAGLGPRRRLWTVPNTFVASANCARYLGADVGFVDIDPVTWCMSAAALEAKLASCDPAELPDVVVPVHFAGLPCDMARIAALAREYGFTIVEDASHAIGAGYEEGVRVGACTFSDMTTFSFHPVKIVTTGEGGVVTTNSDELAARLRLFRTHGITRDPALMTGASHGPWYYEQIDLGFNYRMTDIQAALGASQMRRVDDFITRRNRLADRYRERLASLPLALQEIPEGLRSAFHLMVVCVEGDRRAEVFERMRVAGVGVNVHYIPVHLQPYYRDLGFGEGDFPVAEGYYAGAISLPIYPDLSADDQDHVIAVLEDALR